MRRFVEAFQPNDDANRQEGWRHAHEVPSIPIEVTSEDQSRLRN